MNVDGRKIRCKIEHLDDDPKKVGIVEGQRRFYWRGKVVEVSTALASE